MRTLCVAVLALIPVVACGDDAPTDPIDAAVDAPIDAPIDAQVGCGNDLQFTGEYVDWNSTTAEFDGIEEVVWTVVGAPGRTATTAPNGRIILCIDRTATSTMTVVNTPGLYLPARFVADPANFVGAAAMFSARGLKLADQAAEWSELPGAPTFDPTAAQVLIEKQGAAIPLAVTGAGAGYVSDGPDDVTWVSGASGRFVLFVNVPVGAGTATLSSTMPFTGPTTLPLAAGTLTITSLR